MAERRLLRKHLGFELAWRVAIPAIVAGFAALPASGEMAVLVGVAVAAVALVVWLLVTDPTGQTARSTRNADAGVSNGETASELPELEVGGLFDEGVAAPNGEEFTVIARPRRLPIFGSSLVTSAIFGDQYEVRVQAWPHRIRDEMQWSTIAPMSDALTLAHQLVELLKQGQWRPSDGEPSLTALRGRH